MLLHRNTTLRVSREVSPTSLLRESTLQHRFPQHQHTKYHMSSIRHITTLHTSTTSTSPTTNSTHNHLHRCLLPGWRQTTLVPSSPTTRRTTHPITHDDQWMGSRSIPPSLYQTIGLQRHCTAKIAQTLCQQQSFYILSESLGSHYHTSSCQTFADINIHPTLQKGCSYTCHN